MHEWLHEWMTEWRKEGRNEGMNHEWWVGCIFHVDVFYEMHVEMSSAAVLLVPEFHFHPASTSWLSHKKRFCIKSQSYCTFHVDLGYENNQRIIGFILHFRACASNGSVSYNRSQLMWRGSSDKEWQLQIRATHISYTCMTLPTSWSCDKRMLHQEKVRSLQTAYDLSRNPIFGCPAVLR